MINVKEFVTVEEHPDRDFPTFAIKPTEMYPAMIAHIKEALVEGKGPSRFLDLEGTLNPLCMYWDEAKILGTAGMDLGLVPHAQTVDFDAKDKARRNVALECARKWFTELLHQSIGGKPMGVHILAEDYSFKLC
jgi:hypothetical protein